MSKLNELADRYIAMWNETDAARRRDLIAAVWTPDGTYADPVVQGDGHAGIDAMVKAVQERFPGHRFARTSDVDAHHDRIRFRWTLAPAHGAAIVEGVDFGTVAGERLQSITGFFDKVPAASQA
ncbi:MAG TPA: nuclear transport factor 2 family protein [Hyphomicrobiaceae bacterium]|nr:nuclear transport factor 2 family protein [Hyphomicrobiaceae bacterium]